MNPTDLIEFKGTKDGLIIHLNESTDFEVIKNQLITRLEKAKNFFKGANVVSFEGKNLTDLEEIELKSIMNSRFGMTTIEKNISFDGRNGVFNGLDEGITKFYNSTLRSGSKVEFHGNLVIIGDVNPGAKIIAHGNIIIMGALRGVAHAGSNGNGDAYVAAFKLQPTQLRIGKYIARSPDNSLYKPDHPEIAMIKNDQIVIEPYLTKKNRQF